MLEAQPVTRANTTRLAKEIAFILIARESGQTTLDVKDFGRGPLAIRFRLLESHCHGLNFGFKLRLVDLIKKIKGYLAGKEAPEHLKRGELGERAAKKHLRKLGLKFLVANYKSPRGEIDLIFRDADCLVFVEVKARSSEEWTRPAASVNAAKRKRLSEGALDYLKLLKNPEVKIRFDIVEVLLAESEVKEIRHLPNTFPMSKPHRYG